MFYALIALTLVSAAACYLIAERRGANAPFWLIMGVLFGPFALPFVGFARKRQRDSR